MTAAAAGQDRWPSAGLRTPPWLWVWLVYLLAELPAMISGFFTGVTVFSVHVPADVGGTASITVMRMTIVFGWVVFAVLFAGMVPVAFPQLRGRRVERRFGLADDSRPVIAEMQRFVSSFDPSVQLRVTMRADQVARIYPTGWRSARIAVFRPLTVLWRRDPEAAQAVLLHELAHRRHGDQLITGLGSPLPWLIRIGALAYLTLVLGPSAVLLASGPALMTSTTASDAALFAGLIPALVFLPVIALWLAELDADQQAAHAASPGALRRALQAGAVPRAPLAARAVALLSHPPLQLRLPRATARPAGTAALMAAWPVSVAVFVLVIPFVIDASGLFSSQPPAGLRETTVKATVHALLIYDMPLIIATAVVLLTWPALAAPWQRLWSSAPRPGGRQPWWPSLAAASLPAGMLLLSLAPYQATPQEFAAASLPKPPPGSCSPAVGWMLNGGLSRYDPGTDYYQLVLAENNKPAMTAASRRLDATVSAALRNPPPGPARTAYITSMTEYRTAGQEFMNGDTTAAASEDISASHSYIQAVNLLGSDTTPSQLSAGCYQQYSPQQYQRILGQVESALCADQPAMAGLVMDCP